MKSGRAGLLANEVTERVAELVINLKTAGYSASKIISN